MARFMHSGAGAWYSGTAGVKRFETENEAWDFLGRCDAAGKIIH